MNKFKLSLLLFVSSLLITEMSAQPFQILAGGEIYYEIISSKKYKVTAHVYRMCDMPALTGIIAYVYGGSYKIPMSFTRVAISRMDGKCGNGNPCNYQNAVSNAGFEKHTFVDTVDFNASPYDVFVTNSLCTATFGIRMNGRSWTVTTYDPINAFYLDASTNICLSNITRNTSPKFSMEPKFQAYCNMPFNYSPGPLDTMDNDSFAISLVGVQDDINSTINYNGSLNAQYPMTPFCTPPVMVNCTPLPNASPPKGFYFDRQTCMTVFTPTGCSEVGAIKYRIDEYRFNKQKQKHEWLGFVTREMMIQVQNQVGNNPTAIPTANVLNLCKGNKICTTISTTDVKSASQSIADTTSLFWDKGIKNSTFTIKDSNAREKQGEFCWQTKNNVGRTEASFFTVAAFDKQCNVNLTTKTFRVNLNPFHPFSYKNTVGKCGLVKWNLSMLDSFYPNYNGICKTIVRSYNTNGILFSGFKSADSIKLYKDEKIIVEHTFDTLCPVTVRDTLTISGTMALPIITFQKDTLTCKGKTLPFGLKAFGLTGLKSFKWLLNDSIINQKDTNIYVKMQINSRIKIEIENTQGCFSEKGVNYILKQHNAIASINDTLCSGISVTIVPNISGLQGPFDYLWKLNSTDTMTNYSNLVLRLYKDAKVSLTLVDAGQCEFNGSVFYKVLPAVSFNLNSKSEVCKDSATDVKAANISAVAPYTFLWTIDQKGIINNDSVLKLKPSVNTDVSLNVSDLNNCSYKESITIMVVNTPVVKLGADKQACYNSLINIIPAISNAPSMVNYQWSNSKGPMNTAPVLTQKFTSSQTVKLRVSNHLGCFTEDAINISLYPQSVLSIISDSNYLPKSTVSLITTKPFKTYYWFNGRTTALNLFKASDLGPPGKYKLWCRTTDANDCEYNDTVEVTIDKDSRTSTQLMQNVRIYPNPVSDVLMIETLEKSGMDLFSADGRLLVKQILEAGFNQVDLSIFTSGIYFIRLSVSDESGVYKIIKE